MKLDLVVGKCLLAAAALGLLSHAALGAAPDARSVLLLADKAMGGTGLKTIRYAGSGTGANYGQAYQPGQAWPRLSYAGFSRLADYEHAALRDEFARSRAEPTGGGTLPPMGAGEQRATTFVRGTDAWNMVGPVPVPALASVNERLHALWTTPHGAIKAALRNPSTLALRHDGGRAVISFGEPGRFTASIFLNAQNLVQQIDSRLSDPVLGDTAAVSTFADYKDFAGVKFPMRIRQSLGGFAVLDLAVKEVHPNAPAQIEVPLMVRGAADRVTAEQLADGVWLLAGGSHHSVLIEMKQYLILVGSPLYDGRAGAVIAEARKLVPGKELGYVVSTHHHFDHAGGLRGAAAEGATLVTSQLARPYFERMLANPNRISPDALEKSGKKAKLIGVQGKHVFSDGRRVVELHAIEGSTQAGGLLMVYLPAEKLLIEAEAYTPGPPFAPPPPKPQANHLNLVRNIERLKLDVERIAPLRGRVVPLAELYTAIGRKP